MILVFFVYGLAFFTMGFAIALESRQSSEHRLGRSLPYLAAFGLLHSLVEWADMFLLIESATPPSVDLETVRLVRTLLLGISTGALVQFGATLLSAEREVLGPERQATTKTPRHQGSEQQVASSESHSSRYSLFATRYSLGVLVSWWLRRRSWLLRFLPVGLGAMWVMALALLTIAYPLGSRQWLIHADIWARYLLYLPGSFMAGFGLMSEARLLVKTDFHPIARDARFAATTFLLNALVSGLVVPPGQRLPALSLDYDLFQAIFGIPVQVLRAGSALAIAYFILRVLRVFRIQSALQIETANRRQIEAQQEALEAQRRARAEIEEWNRELESRIQERTAEISLRNRQLLAVNSIAASVSRSFDLEETLGETLRKTLEALDADGGGIFLSGQQGTQRAMQLSWGLPEDFARTISQTRLDAVMVGQIGEAGQAKTGPDGSPGGEDECPAASPRSFLTAPLKAKGRVVGVICVAKAGDPGFGSEDSRLLTAIGHQVGVAVENARLFGQVQNMAALEERERIAREMHDGLAQVIGFLGIKTRVVRQLVAGGKLEQAGSDLGKMQEAIQEVYTDVRQSILSLRTATELERGLVAAIRESASDFTEQNAIPLELTLPEQGDLFLPTEAEVQLVRIVQEALTNVRKHARATRVWIRLEQLDDETILEVEDDGVGFDPCQMPGRSRRCFGLETMRERAESVGASFHVISVPGEGTRIQVRYPLEQRARQAKRIPQDPAG